MRKKKACALCVCVGILAGIITGCGREEYSSNAAIEEIAKVNSERAREETEAENAERAKRATEIAKAKAEVEAQAEAGAPDTELAMEGNVGIVGVGSTKREGVKIPTYIYYPKDYNSDNSYPMVIMFAGFAADHDNGTRFKPLADSLNDKGIMVVMYDNPGYGRSEETNLGYTFTNIKNDAVDVIMYMYANYHIGRVGALGYDVGGRIVMELQVDGTCNFDQIELIAPFCRTDEFIDSCFGTSTWGELKKEAIDKGYSKFGDQEYSKEWFLEWEAKEDTLIADFVKNYKGRRCMLMYAINDDEVSYDTMSNLQKLLECAAIISDSDGHDMGVRDWESPDSTQRTVKEQTTAFMESLKD